MNVDSRILLGALLFGFSILNTCAEKRSYLYMRNATFDGHTCLSGDTVDTFEDTRSAMDCIARCMQTKSLDIFYDPETEMCVGCYTLHSNDLPPAEPVRESPSWYFTPALECPSSFVRYNTSCYKVTSSLMTWDDSKDYCHGEQAYLASVDDAEENIFVGNWLESTGIGASDTRIYFGFTDAPEEGTWRTTNGDIPSYTNWNQWEPSDWTGEDCATINLNTTSPKMWHDGFCTELHYAVCEMDLSVGDEINSNAD